MSHRRDVYCYECKKYYRDVNVFHCPKCKSEDADVYPHAEHFNRDIERKMLHKEAWGTTQLCDECNTGMMYRDDGYEKLLICRNKDCNNFMTMKQLSKVGKSLTDIKTKAKILFF